MQSSIPEKQRWQVIAYDDHKWQDFLKGFERNDRLYIESFMIRVAEEFGTEIQRSSDVKYLRNGVREFRIRRNPHVLVRVMFRLEPERTLFIVGFYDKKKHPAKSYQQDQIEKAERR